MRLLANENFPAVAVEALRNAGHDVLWIWECDRGAPDERVLERAAQDRRVLLTFDKDFGALVFRRGVSASCGIVLFRAVLAPAAIAQLAVRTLESRSDWDGSFAV